MPWPRKKAARKTAAAAALAAEPEAEVPPITWEPGGRRRVVLSAAQGAQLHRLGVAPAVEALLRQCPEPEEVFCAAQPRADDGGEEASRQP